MLAVIESFIQTALPVSSEMVSQVTQLGVSPATIRNAMARLEEEGYITHPHTSAGRVPTVKGYRFYVDHLLASECLSPEDKTWIEEALRVHSEMTEKMMEKVVRLLSRLTNQVAVVLLPQWEASFLKRIELILVGEREVLVVLLTNAGIIKSALVPLAEETERGELLRISHFINTELVNMSLRDVCDTLYRRILDERSSFFYVCKRAKEIIDGSGLAEEEEKLYLEGTHTILDKPEFRSFERIQPVLSALEEKRRLVEILRRDASSEDLHVYIGDETGYESIRGCTLVTAGYRIGKKSGGTLGVIGPTRLDYGRIMPIVRHIASKIMEWTETF